MMNTMTSSGPALGFGTLALVHFLAATAFSIGILFFILYAYKSFTAAQLKSWALWLTVGGLVAAVLTMGAMHGTSWTKGKRVMMESSGMMHMGMMDDDDDDTGSSRGMMMQDGMDMSMNGMTTMLKGKTGDDFDAAFLEMMIPHHQGAIDMAKLALTNAKHDEVKNMARSIMNAQQREIDEMNVWMQNWGYAK